MLTTLLESQHQRTRNIQFQLVSVTLHVGLILAAVVATRGVVEAIDPPEAPVTRIYFPPPPPERTEGPMSPAPVLPQLPAMPTLPVVTHVPDVLPIIDFSRNLLLTNPDELIVVRGPVRTGQSQGSDVGGMTVDQVDRPARLLPGSGRPVYPEQLRSAGLGGEVVVQFVIDTAGRADMLTLTVLQSSHAWLTGSVKRALEKARFAPAEFGGGKVRQVVRMPFVFSLQR